MGNDQEAAERIVIAGAEDFLAGAVNGPIDTPFAVQLIVDAALNRRSIRIDLVPVKERAESVIAELDQLEPERQSVGKRKSESVGVASGARTIVKKTQRKK